MPNMKLSIDYVRGSIDRSAKYFLLQVDTDYGTYRLRVSEHQHTQLERDYPGGAAAFFSRLANLAPFTPRDNFRGCGDGYGPDPETNGAFHTP